MTELAPPQDNAAPPITPPVTPPVTPPAADWRASLPDDVKNNPTMSKFTTIEGLAKSYVNLEKQFGADKIIIPKEGDAEGWAKAYDALGRPKEPSAYDFKPVQLPEGMQYDTALEEKFRPVAHNLGLTQKQAQGMRDWFAANQGEAFSAATAEQKEARETAINDLKRELGAGYDGHKKAAEAALLHLSDKDTLESAKKNGLMDDPFFIKIFGKMGREFLGEDKLKASGVTVEDAPDQLKARITEFRVKHNAALYDKTHAEHQIRVDELTALTTRLHGDKPVAA